MPYFYKYDNRNSTYITDEFAEKLIKSLPYTPVKGIYESMLGDYEDHGKERSEGRIYGIVPEDPEFAWEDHEDEDGITRTYATCSVLLFTALYKEASEIVGKAQSMELYRPSIKGEYQIVDGTRYFVYTEGCFLGLQILGEDTLPCFEGAQFFSLLHQLEETLEKYQLNSSQTIGGENKMPKFLFKLSDDEKYEALFNVLNPNFNADGDWTVDKCIVKVYDTYAIYVDSEGKYYRAYYTKNADDTVTIDRDEECFIIDVNNNEYKALTAIQAINEGTYEKLDENYSAAIGENTDLKAVNSSLTELIAAKENECSTLVTEKDALTEENTTLRAQHDELTQEVQDLRNYKLQLENAQKAEILNKYSLKLPEETIGKFKDNLDNYSVANLERELAYELVQSDATIFNVRNTEPLIPVNTMESNGLTSILAKYKK